MKKKFIRLSVAFIVLTFIASFALQQGTVFAGPNEGPDPVDFSQSYRYGNSYPNVPRLTSYVVSSDGFTDILNTTLKIYLPGPNGSVSIYDHHLCYNQTQQAGVRGYDVSYQLSSGAVTRYRVYSPTGGSDNTQYGNWNGSNPGCVNQSLFFNLSGAQQDPNTGMYQYILQVTALANGRYSNNFHLVGSAGSIISQDSSTAASSFAMSQTYPIPGGSNPQVVDPADPYKNYTNWSLRFAPDCTVTTPTVTDYVEIFDDDNRGNPDVQPQPFLIKLQEFNRAGVYQRDVPALAIQFPDGFGGWNFGPDGTYNVYTTASKKRARIAYVFNRDMVYQWKIDSVYYDNTIQVQLPWDNVYYYRSCQVPEAKLKAGMTAAPAQISQEDTATFSPTISVSGFRSGMTVNCSITRTMYPPGGGTTNLGGQPCVDGGGNGNITVNGNGTIALRSNTYNAPTTAVPGSRVCDTITITNPSDNKYYNSPANDKTAQACVTVAKSPYVHFMGNDVWAGGGFEDVNALCNAQSDIMTVARQLANGTIAGSVTEYGAFALGSITTFGSASKAMVSPAAGQGKLTTFANLNTANLGFYNAPRHCVNSYASKYTGVPITNEPYYMDVGLRPSGVWHISGNREFSGALQGGSKQIYYVEGDVTISGNIKYPSNYSSIDDIPSLVIIATGSITVNSGAEQIDGLFVAKGNFNTCNPPAGNLSVSICNNQLVVNGAVVTNRLNLLRTNGADGSTDATKTRPAELFNFNAEMYLRSSLINASGPSVRTINQIDLPPRY
jgi:hypothetical protein